MDIPIVDVFIVYIIVNIVMWFIVVSVGWSGVSIIITATKSIGRGIQLGQLILPQQ